ncbi:hypothetical protein NP233_g5778 [Leucocoprinus birnbaumii]|uniref:Nephrocystin 3-like N-terminal domain-containing protein n=1 Tax=Leucocoprinus birnbaumii TaxID=56174 RepID=A0AAD5VS81_9AGAR|nr:hypothetical protein NP233_g5778 [Leucocoprinus birnbaumii]
MFDRAHDLVISNSHFVDNSRAGSGLEILLNKSMPDAFHDSGARHPPPRCHYGTRMDYIAQITSWALGTSDHQEPILWMYGPFGVGKTAVAQSSAEALKPENKLIATLFFSRSNTNRDDPQRVFTSIAYQVATICEQFSDLIDARIRKDPALTTKSLPKQFEDLIVSPLSKIDVAQSGLKGCVVIIDGLDECRGAADQSEIIEIIATSARNQTTPFRWFITSRPEDSIIQTMNAHSVTSVSSRFELPVSREIDHEILVYLTDNLNQIRKHYCLPKQWPSEEAIALLVEHTAGLWIYAATIIRFIKDVDSFGPEDQLRIVLEFANSISRKVGPRNPLAEMDLFYVLIMERVPSNVRLTVRRVLFLHSWDQAGQGMGLDRIATTLGLSLQQIHRSCATIQSVAELHESGRSLTFYHASFLDFLKDSARSGDLCIHGQLLIDLRHELLDSLQGITFLSADSSRIVLPPHIVLPEEIDIHEYYQSTVFLFFDLCCFADYPIDTITARSLTRISFSKLFGLLPLSASRAIDGYEFRKRLPAKFRGRILWQSTCPFPGCLNTKAWIWGRNENAEIAYTCLEAIFIADNRLQAFTAGNCRCGAPSVPSRTISREHHQHTRALLAPGGFGFTADDSVNSSSLSPLAPAFVPRSRQSLGR